jgi:PAS domain S-box-containing protein
MSNDTSLESAADEAKRLRRCLNDVVSIMALPALWAGREPSQIVSTLLDTLLGRLRLGFVFARLNDPAGGPPTELVRMVEGIGRTAAARQISGSLDSSLGDAPSKWPPSARVVIGDADVSVAPARLGIDGEIGIIVAGSHRVDFPGETERLLLDVAANQAAVGLQQARLLSEQTWRANESERESRLIVDSIPGLVALLSSAGYVEVVNRELLAYFGQTLEELRQWGTNGTVHPEDLPHVVDVFTRSIASGTPYDITQRLRRADGVYRWIQNRGFPLRDMKGQIARWCVLLTDIDDRKRAEEALVKRERELRLLVETIPALMWRGTPEGDLDYLNERAVKYLGHTAESLSGGRWIELVHPDHRDATVRRWLHSATTGLSYDDIYKLRRADGQYRWIQSVGEPFYDGEGRIAHWYGLVIDIDDLKRTEEALRESERESRLIVASIPGLVAVLTPAGELEGVNNRVVEYCGRPAEELRHWATNDTLHPDHIRLTVRMGIAYPTLRWRVSVVSVSRASSSRCHRARCPMVRASDRYRRSQARRGGASEGLRQLRRRPATEQDGQLHHGPRGRRPQLVRGSLAHLRVRSSDEGYPAGDSRRHSPRGHARVRSGVQTRH